MKSKHFFLNLARSNLIKNRREYFPYFLCCVFTVFFFFNIVSFQFNPSLADLQGGQNVVFLFFLGTVVIAIFSCILLFYTNNYLVKGRHKELGLYGILGMEKRHITRVFGWESAILGVLSILCGLLTGAVFHYFMFLVLHASMQFAKGFSYHFSWYSVLGTAALYAVIFLAIFVRNAIKIRKASLLELSESERHSEKKPRFMPLKAALGCVALAIGYGIACFSRTATEIFMLFFPAVLFVILATYLLFSWGSMALLYFLKTRKQIYYKKQNFIAISHMIHRMGQNAKGLASICILCTMSLIAVAGTLSLAVGQDHIIRTQYPNDVLMQVKDFQSATKQVQALAKKHGVSLKSIVEKSAVVLSREKSKELFVNQDSDLFAFSKVIIYPEQYYNQNWSASIQLQEGQTAIFSSSPERLPSNIRVNDFSLIPVQISEHPDRSISEVSAYQETLLVVNANTFKKIVQEAEPDAERKQLEIMYQDQSGDIAAFEKEVSEKFEARIQNDQRQLLRTTDGGFLFIGVFMGLLFTMAAALIIYYKQISEGAQDRERFSILQKVGMGAKEIKKTVDKQILLLFFLPLTVATIHVAVAFRPVSMLLKLFNLHSIQVILLCHVVVLAIYSLLYVVIYKLTAQTYYGIVKREDHMD